MTGIAGSIFSPLAVTYISAVLASLVVALTVTPALSLILLGSGELPPETPFLVGWCRNGYTRLLRKIERWHSVALAAAAVLVVVGLMVIPFLGATFIRDLREGHFVLPMTMLPGTSLQQSVEFGYRVTQLILKVPGGQICRPACRQS